MIQRAGWAARVAAVSLIGLAGPVLPWNQQSSEAEAQELVHAPREPLAGRASSTSPDSPSLGRARTPGLALLAKPSLSSHELSSTQSHYLSVLNGLPGAVETRVTRVLRRDLQAPSLRLDLGENLSVLAVRRPVNLDGRATRAWLGDVVGGGYALFVRHGRFLHGFVQTHEQTFKISPIGEELCALQRVLPERSDAPNCVGEAHAANGAPDQGFRMRGPDAIRSRTESQEPGANTPRLDVESAVTVDVLVAYESTVTDFVPDIVGHIEFLAAWANLSYVNSRIHTAAGPCWQGEQCVLPQLRVVTTTPLECRNCLQMDLSNLLLNNRFASIDDGWFDEIHEIRDDVAADVCVLMTAVDRPVGNGSAKLGTPDPRWAFCLAETPYSLLHPYIFAHEIGHLQGAGHFGSAGDRVYAKGYCHNPAGGEPEDRFWTIMCTQSTARIPYWSNPELNYETRLAHVFPMGDEEHNNARRLNETALLVASHRGRNVTPVEVSDFEIRAVGDEARLSWRLSAATIRETAGVHVQRSRSQYGPFHNRTSAPLLPASEMSWDERGLERDETSWYRLVLLPFTGAPAVIGPMAVHAVGWTNGLQPPVIANGATRIRYSVGPTAAAVHLAVYDVRGRLVRLLETRHRDAGAFEVSWDGRNEAGNTVARGVYLIQLKAGSEQRLRKLLFLSN